MSEEQAEYRAVKAIMDSYDEFGAVLDPEANLPKLASRVHTALGELVHLQDEITRWQRMTFPNSTKASKIAHLRGEVEELARAETPVEHCEEIADCFLLLCAIADAEGVDVLGEARRKLEINLARQWGEPDENGVARHITGDAP